jgi:hypothetical protein
MATKKARRWGKWYLNTFKPRSLDIYPVGDRGCSYEVILFGEGATWQEFLEWLGHWCEHLIEKRWMGPNEMFDFIRAAQSIYNNTTDLHLEEPAADRAVLAERWWNHMEERTRTMQ